MNELSKRSSFTAANAYPLKVFKDKDLLESLKNGKIIPIHVQLNPTNICNLNCSFCSCSKRDKHLSMDFRVISHAIKNLKELGCKAVTITGGGEPILHKNFPQIVSLLKQSGIKIGLVSNGEAIGTVPKEVLEQITWCRISCSDDRRLIGKLKTSITEAVEKAPNVDWAFSYVVTKKFDALTLAEYINFANTHNFTHIRVVSDLLDLDTVQTMDFVKNEIKFDWGVDLSNVIFQGRKEFKPGQKKCLISLLKPNIGADGGIYPCCGVQYAQKNMALDYTEKMRVGEINDIKEIYEKQAYFDGSVCARCYYSDYNEVLELLLGEMKHVEFL